MVKLFASQAAEKASFNTAQIHGGHEYDRDYPVERYYPDNRLTSIGEGANEIKRLVITRQWLTYQQALALLIHVGPLLCTAISRRIT